MIIFIILVVIVVLVCIGHGESISSQKFHNYRMSDYGSEKYPLRNAFLGEELDKSDQELLMEDDDIREEFRDEVDYDFYDEVDETIYDNDIRDEFCEF